MKRLLLVDGMNFMHRARSGFTLGDHAVSFNFFRNFRSLVETIDPESVIFVLEGTPRHRLVEFSDYKANRKEVVDPEDPASVKKAEELKSFFRQAEECVDLMKRSLPVTLIRHPHYECDDMIYSLIASQMRHERTEKVCFGEPNEEVEFVVASNDTDFIQLHSSFDKVKLYNPHEKAYVEHPGYDYVAWKALRGDGADNIPGLPGVGDVTAEKAMGSAQVLEELLTKPGNRELFERNRGLISFREVPKDERLLTEAFRCEKPDWVDVIGTFKDWGFNSFFKPTKAGTTQWDKFKATFSRLK